MADKKFLTKKCLIVFLILLLAVRLFGEDDKLKNEADTSVNSAVKKNYIIEIIIDK